MWELSIQEIYQIIQNKISSIIYFQTVVFKQKLADYMKTLNSLSRQETKTFEKCTKVDIQDSCKFSIEKGVDLIVNGRFVKGISTVILGFFETAIKTKTWSKLTAIEALIEIIIENLIINEKIFI